MSKDLCRVIEDLEWRISREAQCMKECREQGYHKTADAHSIRHRCLCELLGAYNQMFIQRLFEADNDASR